MNGYPRVVPSALQTAHYSHNIHVEGLQFPLQDSKLIGTCFLIIGTIAAAWGPYPLRNPMVDVACVFLCIVSFLFFGCLHPCPHRFMDMAQTRHGDARGLSTDESRSAAKSVLKHVAHGECGSLVENVEKENEMEPFDKTDAEDAESLGDEVKKQEHEHLMLEGHCDRLKEAAALKDTARGRHLLANARGKLLL